MNFISFFCKKILLLIVNCNFIHGSFTNFTLVLDILKMENDPTSTILVTLHMISM